MVTIYNTTLSATSQRHFSDGLGGGMLELKAIIIRPGLDGWNAISRKMCLEDMLIEIGELGRGYVKKGKKA